MRVFLYKDLYDKYNYVSVVGGAIVIEAVTEFVPRYIMTPNGRPFVSGADIPKVRRHCEKNKLDFIEMDAMDYIRNGPRVERQTNEGSVVREPDGSIVMSWDSHAATITLSPSRLEGF